MSKAEDKKVDNNWSRQYCMDEGRTYYRQAIEMEDNEDPNQKKIDALLGSSAKDFFFGLALGDYEAPRCLAISFNQGTGVKEDKYMSALLYGVALELKDPKCATTKNMPKIPKFMKPAITEITKLVKATQAKIPNAGVDAASFIEQLDIFNEKIAQTSGRLLSTFFVSEDTAKQSIAKFAAEHPGWVYHDDAYFQHLMDVSNGGGAAAGGAASHLEAAFSSHH